MITKKIKKILSGIIIAAYFIIYAAPVGLCISSVPQINTGIQKPALRSSSQPTFLKLEGDISLTKGNPKISLSLRNSDVQQVLRMFADKAGLNIVFHNSVSGTVTLDLVNVPLNEAFKLVMQITDLTYFVDNNTMIVASASAAQSMNLSKQELMVIPVKYVDAAMLAGFLNQNIFSMNKPGLSNSQIAITNPSANEILIFGTKNDYIMAKKVVAQFDVKPLEQAFVVNHSTPKEMANLICNLLFAENQVTSTAPASSSGSSSGTANTSSSSSTSPSSSSGSASSSPGSSSAESSSASPVSTDGSSSSTSAPTTGVLTGGASSITAGNNSDPGSGLSLGTGVIACQYNSSVKAGNLASLTTPSLAISYFPQRGTISVVGGSQQQMQRIKDFILKNDKKQPQAYLEVSIIELSESGMREFDNTWRMYSEFFSGGFDGTTATNSNYPTFLRGDTYTVTPATTTMVQNPITGVTEPVTTAATVLTKYTGAPTLTYSINYLIQNQKGRVLANPRILITNGEASSIDLSSDYVKTVTSQIITSSGSLTPTVQRTYSIGSDEGIKVDLTPFISPEGYVTLDIKPVYSTIKEKVYAASSSGTGQDLAATLLQRRNLDLKGVRIKDGETLIIGGMIREDEQKTISKFPVLGDLPGVGMFFRNTGSTKTKQELVIMITPKLIKDTEDLVNSQDTTL